MKLFISQPMKGKTDDEILNERNRVICTVKKELNCDDIDVIDSFFQGAPAESKPLWYIGESIKMLADADLAYFTNGWQNARGCKIEHDCAKAYGVKCVEE